MPDPTAGRPRPRPESDALVNDRDAGIERLLEIMARLRDPESGCPWDIEQDFDTIAPYTIEEAYEVADAIERRAWDELEGELGDLLLQSVYHAQMGAERGLFDFSSVVRRIADKMVARHPHVFGPDSNAKTAEQQVRDWEAQKEAERAARGQRRILDGVALGLPALLRAFKLQRRMARAGFDWPDIEGVAEKVCEEARELAEARAARDPAAIEDEVGDLLFAVVNLARHLGVDPEAALRRTNAKVVERFNFIEKTLVKQGKNFSEMTLGELDALWEAAKRAERDKISD